MKWVQEVQQGVPPLLAEAGTVMVFPFVPSSRLLLARAWESVTSLTPTVAV
jgi:hypothetical protein